MLNMLKDQVVVQLADYRIFLFISNNHKNNKIIEKISNEFDENIPNGTDILLSANFEEIILLDEYDDNLENKYNPNLSIIKIGHKGSLFDKEKYNWLWQRNKIILSTEDQDKLIHYYQNKFKWIARDKDGCCKIFIHKPKIDHGIWISNSEYKIIDGFNYTVFASDNIPRNISNMIKRINHKKAQPKEALVINQDIKRRTKSTKKKAKSILPDNILLINPDDILNNNVPE